MEETNKQSEKNKITRMDAAIGIDTGLANMSVLREYRTLMNAALEERAVAKLGEGLHWRAAGSSDVIRVWDPERRKRLDIHSIDVKNGHLILRDQNSPNDQPLNISALSPEASWKEINKFADAMQKYRNENPEAKLWATPMKDVRARYDTLKAKPAFASHVIVVLNGTGRGYSFDTDAEKVAVALGKNTVIGDDGKRYIMFEENETAKIAEGLAKNGEKIAKARMSPRTIKITNELIEAFKAGKTNSLENTVVMTAAKKDPVLMSRISSKKEDTSEQENTDEVDEEKTSKEDRPAQEEVSQKAAENVSLSDQNKNGVVVSPSDHEITASPAAPVYQLSDIQARHARVKKIAGISESILIVSAGDKAYSFGLDARKMSKIINELSLSYTGDSTSYVTFNAKLLSEYNQRLHNAGEKTQKVGMPSPEALKALKERKPAVPRREATVHEDSDAETNVAALARKYIESGLEPKAAEKKAKEYFENAKRAADTEKKESAAEKRALYLRKWEEARRKDAEDEKRIEERRRAAEKRRQEQEKRRPALAAFLVSCGLAAAAIKEENSDAIILNRSDNGKYYILGSDADFFKKSRDKTIMRINAGDQQNLHYIEIPEKELQGYIDSIIGKKRSAAIYDPAIKDGSVVSVTEPFTDRRSLEQHKTAISNALGQAVDHLGAGEWINAGAKAAPRIYSSVGRTMTLTPFNNILMAIDSDRHKYATNIYCTGRDAKEGGFPIMGVTQKQKELGLDKEPANQNLRIDWIEHRRYKPLGFDDVITADSYSKLSAEDKLLYHPAYEESRTHPTRYTCIIDDKAFDALEPKDKLNYEKCSVITYYTMFNVDQSTMGLKEEGLREQYRSLIDEYGWKNAIPEADIVKAIKKGKEITDPGTVFFAEIRQRTTPYFRVYGEDAVLVAAKLGIEPVKHNIGGEEIPTVTINEGKQWDVESYLYSKGVSSVTISDADRSLMRSGYGQLETVSVAEKADAMLRKVADSMHARIKVDAMAHESHYSPNDDTIYLGRSTTPSKASASENISHVQDVIRALVAATGNDKRLNRHAEDDLFADDNRKFDALVQELASAHYMLKLGLPARISESHRSLIPYWQQEIRSSQYFLPNLEKEVNNAVEVIDDYRRGINVNYDRIRGKERVLPAVSYTISRGVARAANIAPGTFGYVKDPMSSTAHVVFPKGISVNGETSTPGYSKQRIRAAFTREGFRRVVFHNNSGGSSLRIPNSAYASMEAGTASYKGWDLVNIKKIDIEALRQREKIAALENVAKCKNQQTGQWGLFIHPKGEQYFTIFLPGTNFRNDMSTCFKHRTGMDIPKDERQRNRDILFTIGRKYYDIVRQHPDLKSDVVTPHVPDGVDIARIKKVSFARVNYAKAKTEGVPMKIRYDDMKEGEWSPVRKADLESYSRYISFFTPNSDAQKKFGQQIGGVVFGDLLSKSLSRDQQQSQSEQTSQSQNNSIEKDNSNDEDRRRPIRIHV